MKHAKPAWAYLLLSGVFYFSLFLLLFHFHPQILRVALLILNQSSKGIKINGINCNKSKMSIVLFFLLCSSKYQELVALNQKEKIEKPPATK